VKRNEIRKQVLADHVALRRTMGRLEGLARRVFAGHDSHLCELRSEATDFLDALLTHMKWEDVHLAPALRKVGARGEYLAAKLAREHAEQRELLRHILRGLVDVSRPGCIVSRNLLDLCGLLREDMVDEERILLDARVLRRNVAFRSHVGNH
jgi:iron-sulfur cluster repair protein YtfE (RIC family)